LSKGYKGFLAIVILLIAVLAFVLIYQHSLRPALQRRQYPLAFTAEILAAAAEFDLPPALVAAVIHTESGFREGAVSARGALGLMQLMPDTARDIDKKLCPENGYLENIESYICEPARNIRYGCYYLRWLLDRYDGRLQLALAAYNAGPGRVREWMEEYGLSEDGQALKSIPYPETKDYVSRVLAARTRYENLYTEELKPND